jgi:hypothetical protein
MERKTLIKLAATGGLLLFAMYIIMVILTYAIHPLFGGFSYKMYDDHDIYNVVLYVSTFLIFYLGGAFFSGKSESKLIVVLILVLPYLAYSFYLMELNPLGAGLGYTLTKIIIAAIGALAGVRRKNTSSRKSSVNLQGG